MNVSGSADNAKPSCCQRLPTSMSQTQLTMDFLLRPSGPEINKTIYCFHFLYNTDAHARGHTNLWRQGIGRLGEECGVGS